MNFFENQGANDAIPIMLTSTDRDPFGCTQDQGVEKNQAKPIFGQFALEIARVDGSYEWIRPHFGRLMRFYDRWFTRYAAPCGLITWGADVAIGVDNDPATYGRPEFSSANLLLNCLLYQDLLAARQIAEALKLTADAGILQARAEKLRRAILAECWDPIDRFFYSVDVQCRDARDKYIPKEFPKGMDMEWSSLPLKIKSFTGFLPMWCGIAASEQARDLVERHLKNPAEFAAVWGVPSLSKAEKMYSPGTNSSNPSNWLGPVWIISNYMVYEGLRRYGYNTEAAALADNTTRLLANDLKRTGTLHEYYNPDTGAPNFNAGFLSWNTLIGLMQK